MERTKHREFLSILVEDEEGRSKNIQTSGEEERSHPQSLGKTSLHIVMCCIFSGLAAEHFEGTPRMTFLFFSLQGTIHCPP